MSGQGALQGGASFVTANNPIATLARRLLQAKSDPKSKYFEPVPLPVFDPLAAVHQGARGAAPRHGGLFFLTPEQGAETFVYLAASDEVTSVSGEYFYKKKRAPVSKKARDQELAERLWSWSEKEVGWAA